MTVTNIELLEHYQDQLADYLEAGTFDFDEELTVVDYEEFQRFILTMDSANDYQCAYRLGQLIFLEAAYFDRDDSGWTSRVQRERSWSYGSMRAFELTTEVLPLPGEDSRSVSVRTTAWYCLRSTGQVVAVKSTLDGATITDIRR
jgi:hypothetical protein